eukprot:255769_1
MSNRKHTCPPLYVRYAFIIMVVWLIMGLKQLWHAADDEIMTSAQNQYTLVIPGNNHALKQYNLSINHLWASYPYRHNRFYISESCKWIYIVTLKTGSRTSREMVDRSECGYGNHIMQHGISYKSCYTHECNETDLVKLRNNDTNVTNRYFSMLFTRHPIHRFESLWNFGYEYREFTRYRNTIKKIYKRELNRNTSVYKYLYNLTHGNVEHIKYLLHIQYLHKQITNGEEFPDNRDHMVFRHHQPIYLYSCFKNECFIPSFLGKTEQLQEDMHWINDTNKLNMNIPSRVFWIHYYQKYYFGYNKTTQISKGITYNYTVDGLLPLCQLYWNDFMCSKYAIPVECKRANDIMQWNFPYFCVDLKDTKMKWPESRKYLKL